MTLHSLEEFKSITQRFHSSYHLINIGLADLSKTILNSHNDLDNDDFIIKNDDGDIVSSVPYSHVLKGLSNEGPISQIVAHGILNWIYAAWNDKYRKLIALELGVDNKSVMCDVMGDIRLIRNAISHDFGSIEFDIKKLKELNWFSNGRIVLKIDDMNKIQMKINSMDIYLITPNK